MAMSSVFGNYPSYFAEIVSAFKTAPAPKQKIVRTVGGTTAVLVALGIGCAAATVSVAGSGDRELAVSAMETALSAGDTAMDVDVVDDDSPLMTASGTSVKGSAKTKITRNIISSISDAELKNAEYKPVNETTSELIIKTTTGAKVKATVKKEGDTATVVDMKAEVSPDDMPAAAATEQKATDEVKAQFTDPVEAPDKSLLAEKLGIDAGKDGKKADEETDENKESVKANAVALYPGLVLALPQGYELQENDPVDDQPAYDTSKLEPGTKVFHESNDTWHGPDGAIITRRTEMLDPSIANLNGKEAAEKMMGYWKETSSAVAKEGAAEDAPEPEYTGKVFYDADLNLWGYRGSAKFADGDKDVNYERAVFISEDDDMMITVSYRKDTPKGEPEDAKGMTEGMFWGMFCKWASAPEWMANRLNAQAEKLFDVIPTPEEKEAAEAEDAKDAEAAAKVYDTGAVKDEPAPAEEAPAEPAPAEEAPAE